MMTRGRGGVTIPPKNDDVIYEQPLIISIQLLLTLVNFGQLNPGLVDFDRPYIQFHYFNQPLVCCLLKVFLDFGILRRTFKWVRSGLVRTGTESQVDAGLALLGLPAF